MVHQTKTKVCVCLFMLSHNLLLVFSSQPLVPLNDSEVIPQQVLGAVSPEPPNRLLITPPCPLKVLHVATHWEGMEVFASICIDIGNTVIHRKMPIAECRQRWWRISGISSRLVLLSTKRRTGLSPWFLTPSIPKTHFFMVHPPAIRPRAHCHYTKKQNKTKHKLQIRLIIHMMMTIIYGATTKAFIGWRHERDNEMKLRQRIFTPFNI